MLGTDLAFVVESAGGAYLHALATACATGLAPGLHQVRDHHAIDPASHHIPYVSAFNFGTNPHAACAQDAAVVIACEALVRCIHLEQRVAIGQPHMGHPQLLAHRLQLAVAVGHAYRADMIALGKQQFDDGLTVLVEPFGVCRDLHALLHARHTGRKQLVVPLDLDQAEATGPDIAQPIQMTQGRNVDAVLARHLEDRLVWHGTDILAVNDQRFYVRCHAHAKTSASLAETEPLAGAFLRLQTPAVHFLLMM